MMKILGQFGRGKSFISNNDSFCRHPIQPPTTVPESGKAQDPLLPSLLIPYPSCICLSLWWFRYFCYWVVFVVSDDQCDEQKAIMSDHFSWKDGKFLISTFFSPPHHFYCSICVKLIVSFSKTISQPERLSAMISRSINRSRYIADPLQSKSLWLILRKKSKVHV